LPIPEPGTSLLTAIVLVPFVFSRAGRSRRCALPIALLVVMGSTLAGADLRDGLISFWPFDGTGADASGFNRDLTLQGGVGFASGLFGQALDMHKSDSTFAQRLVDDEVYDFGGSDFTVQTWANYYSTNTEQVFIEKFTSSGGPGWTLTKQPTHTVQFYYSSGAATSPAQTISTNAWHYFVARRSGNQVHVWRDGTVIASGTIGTISNSATPLYVGRRNPTGQTSFGMNGRLDDVAIWSRARSDTEIAHLYNVGAGNPVIPVPEPASGLTMAQVALAMMLKARITRR
jgi:hypothetical protein